MKALTPNEILREEQGNEDEITYNAALRAMDRYRDQEMTILRHVFQQKISDATDLALKEGMRIGRQELMDYGKKMKYD